MSEIQSAEEFVKFIDDNYINLGAMTKQMITDLLRARDKAWVERVRYRINHLHWQEANCAGINLAIDGVLRELGGKQ